MKLEERVVGDVTVLALSGRMTRDEEYGVLKQRVCNLVHEGRRKLVLNLAAVSYDERQNRLLPRCAQRLKLWQEVVRL